MMRENTTNLQIPFRGIYSPILKLPEPIVELIREIEEDMQKVKHQSFESLTTREQEVLKLVEKGESSKTIASMLYISDHTVKTHRKNILRKLNARNLHEAIRINRAYSLVA